MFYYLNGQLTLLDTGFCVVECGGVGYKLTVSLITAELLSSQVGTMVKVYAHMSVREDGIELFGFSSAEEKDAFTMLTGVSGVGPKAAMSILSIMTPDNLALAIATDDSKSIARAQNIGKKTAARIILELKDKVAGEIGRSTADASNGISISAPHVNDGNIAEATEALMVLGYDKASVANALKGVDPSLDPGSIIRQALKNLAR